MLVPKGDMFEVFDTYSKSNAEPIADATQSDVSVKSAVRGSDGARIVTLQRALTTSDMRTDIALSAASPLYLLYAYHRANGDRSRQHSDSGASANRVQLFRSTNAATPSMQLGALPTSYRDAHIALMLVAWNVLPLPIVLLARFFKPLGHIWFLLHRGLAIGVVLISLVALALAVLHHELGQRVASHFQSAHAILGLIVILLSIFQVCLFVY